jgi:hypothetical protein
MGLKYKKLFDKIVDIKNLQIAYKNTCKGKRDTYSYLEFKQFDQYNLLQIQKELISGNYKIGNYRHFYIYDPKKRLISALSFKDRIVQHALCNIITNIFDKTFLPNSFACRKNFGTHKGVIYIQSLLRKYNYKYFLKTDFSRYFPSINTNILHKMIRKKIKCNKTYKLVTEIVPFNTIGIPIGNLTSQLFANVYGNTIDYYLKHNLKINHFARYMDDIVVLGNNYKELYEIYNKIQKYSEYLLKLKISKWNVSSTQKGINFLGYRIWKDYKLIRRLSVIKAKRKVKKYLETNNKEKLQRFLASWHGHIQWGNSYNLKNYIDNIINKIKYL